jgi:hypothetical protein
MSPSLTGSIETVSHRVDRLTIQIDDSFDGFRNRYERAVPEFQTDGFDSFIRHWSQDLTSLMGLAGIRGRCVEYLMGNHSIAQRMYRYNPAILLYAPLRTAIVEDAAHATWFTFDQPSTQFGSFTTLQIAKLGTELDRRFAALLEHLCAPVPAALTES